MIRFVSSFVSLIISIKLPKSANKKIKNTNLATLDLNGNRIKNIYNLFIRILFALSLKLKFENRTRVYQFDARYYIHVVFA